MALTEERKRQLDAIMEKKMNGQTPSIKSGGISDDRKRQLDQKVAERMKLAVEKPQPGFFQSVAQGIAKPFLKHLVTPTLNIGSSIKELAQTGDVGKATEKLNQTRDYGYLGQSERAPVENIGDFSKSVLGGGAEIGSYAIGGGAAKNLAGGALKTAAHGALEGSVAGVLGAGGHEAQQEDATAGSVAKKAAVGGITGGILGGVGGAISGKLNQVKSFNVAKKFTNQEQKVFDLVSPELNKMERTEAIKFGRTIKDPITGKLVIKPNQHDVDMVKVVQPLIKKTNSVVDRVKNIDDEISRVSKDEIVPHLIKHNAPYNQETLTNLFDSIKPPETFKDTATENIYNNAKRVALDIIKRNQKNTLGVYKSRQEFDAQVRKELPKILGTEKYSSAKSAVEDIRNAFNDFIASSVKEGKQEFSDKLYKQHLLFTALDNIAEKEQSNIGKNAVMQYFQKNPTAKKAALIGAGAVGGSALSGLGFSMFGGE